MSLSYWHYVGSGKFLFCCDSYFLILICTLYLYRSWWTSPTAFVFKASFFFLEWWVTGSSGWHHGNIWSLAILFKILFINFFLNQRFINFLYPLATYPLQNGKALHPLRFCKCRFRSIQARFAIELGVLEIRSVYVDATGFESFNM